VLLSNEQTGFVEWTATEGVSSDVKTQAWAMPDFPDSRLFIFGSELGIYSHPMFSSVTGMQDVP